MSAMITLPESGDALLDKATVKLALGNVSDAVLASQDFPAPIWIDGRNPRWSLAAVRTWLANVCASGGTEAAKAARESLQAARSQGGKTRSNNYASQ